MFLEQRKYIYISQIISKGKEKKKKKNKNKNGTDLTLTVEDVERKSDT